MSSLLVFNRVYRLEWRYSQSCWYFRPSFVNYCLSNLLSGSTSPPPLPKAIVQYIQTSCGWVGVGGGVLSCFGDHILQEFNILFWPDWEPTKLLYHPKQKPRRGGGLRQINTCRKVPLHDNFLRDRHLALLSLIFLRSHTSVYTGVQYRFYIKQRPLKIGSTEKACPVSPSSVLFAWALTSAWGPIPESIEIIYRGPGFLAVVRCGFSPTPNLHSVSSIGDTQEDRERETTYWRERGVTSDDGDRAWSSINIQYSLPYTLLYNRTAWRLIWNLSRHAALQPSNWIHWERLLFKLIK